MVYTAEQAAAILGVRVDSIYQAMRRGHLPKRPHPNPPTRAHRYCVTADDLAAYRRQHGHRGRRPVVLRDH